VPARRLAALGTDREQELAQRGVPLGERQSPAVEPHARRGRRDEALHGQLLARQVRLQPPLQGGRLVPGELEEAGRERAPLGELSQLPVEQAPGLRPPGSQAVDDRPRLRVEPVRLTGGLMRGLEAPRAEDALEREPALGPQEVDVRGDWLAQDRAAAVEPGDRQVLGQALVEPRRGAAQQAEQVLVDELVPHGPGARRAPEPHGDEGALPPRHEEAGSRRGLAPGDRRVLAEGARVPEEVGHDRPAVLGGPAGQRAREQQAEPHQLRQQVGRPVRDVVRVGENAPRLEPVPLGIGGRSRRRGDGETEEEEVDRSGAHASSMARDPPSRCPAARLGGRLAPCAQQLPPRPRSRPSG
jgi:hypothetical protein